MKNQDDIFFKKEADAWYVRNESELTPEARRNSNDFVEKLIRKHRLHPKRVLDVGASNGWRLEAMRRARPRAQYVGIEPSIAAVSAGKKQFPKLFLKRGVAAKLPVADASFDLVLAVFMFHWVARDTLLRSVAEIDRVLADGGYLIVSDFLPRRPRKIPYQHRLDIFTWKADYGAMFEASGNYIPVERLYMLTAHAHTRITPRTRDNFRAVATLYKKKIGVGYKSGT